MRKNLVVFLFAILFFFYPTVKAETLVLPDDIEVIEDYAFYNCTNLTGSLIIPDSVITIGAHAFDGCSGLSGIVILPDSVTTVDETAFANTALTVMTAAEYVDAYFGYTIVNGEATLSSCSLDTAHNLILPDTVEGYPVTALSRYLFMGHHGLTGTVVLPSQLREIGDSAFYECTGLTEVPVFPHTLEVIGEGAFMRCSNMGGTIRIPETLRVMDRQAFIGCKLLTGDITVPVGVERWDERAFEDTGVKLTWTHGLIDYHITNNEAIIDRFLGIGNASTAIPSQIEGCPVTKIGYGAFDSCTELTGQLVIPDGVKIIDDKAFYGCTGLTGDLMIPEGVTTINQLAFYECENITGALQLPSTLTYIGIGAFQSAGVSGDLIIPEGVKEIDNLAFYLCGSLNGSLTLPEGLERIGSNAFVYTPLSGTLTLPSTLKRIGNDAFSYTALTGGLVLPDGLQSIGSRAFASTLFTGSVTVPASVTYIGLDAFRTYNGLDVIYEGTPYPGYDIEYSTSYRDSMRIVGYNRLPVENIQLPTEYDGVPVEQIGSNAFENCDMITGQLVIPEGYMYLWMNAFSGCTGLTGVPVLPSTLVSIFDYAFQNCSGLSGTLTIADNVNVSANAFEGTNLTVVQNGSVIYQPVAE